MNLSFILSVAATGIAVVFSALILLIMLLIIMGRIFSVKKKKRVLSPRKTVRKTSELIIKSPKPTKTLPPARSQAENIIDPQIIAVITAAIIQYEEKGRKIKIVDIKKRDNYARFTRSPWGAAGVSESMR